MDLFSDLISAVQSDLTVGAESSLFDTTTIKLAINRSYRKIGSLFKWPGTEDAKKTSAIANQQYYDYPSDWKPDSIWKLTVDDTDYGDPLVFKDFLYEQENNYPSGADYLWANHRLRFFIYPTPTSTGSNNISVWGFKTVDALSVDDDETIFSYSIPEVNEAIVLEAVAILKNKGDVQQGIRSNAIIGSRLFSVEAGQIAATAWSKIQQENSKYEKTTPAFDVQDMFASGVGNRNALRNKTGNF